MPNPSRKSLIPILLFTAVFLAVLLAHARYWWPFYSDDALISLRYADRLLEGRGLNWNDAPPNVEGYSNLLWTLLVALLGLFRVDLIVASRMLGVAGMTVVILAVSQWQLGRACPRASIVSLGGGLVFFTLAAPTAIWAIGGLEQPLVAALLALAIPSAFRLIEDGNADLHDASTQGDIETSETRTTLQLSFVLGLLCVTRPDGPIFSVATLVALLFGRMTLRRPTISMRHLLLLLPLFPVLFYGGQLIFRLAYYGEWVPNTALVKVAPRGVHLERGLDYVVTGFNALQPYSTMAAISIVAGLIAPTRRGRALVLLIIVALWLPYVAYVGGDIHPAHRHLVPIVVVFTFALVDGIDHFMNWAEGAPSRDSFSLARRFARIVVPVLLFLAAFPFLVLQTSHPDNLQVNEERWVWNGQVTGLLLKRAFGEERPTVAVTAAGCIPYWSELPALDMLGLNDHYLPRHPPDTIGEGYLGHELGDGQYVLEQAPDIICFHTGIYEGIFRSGSELQEMDEFHQRYSPVRLLGREPKEFTATLWLLRSSPKVGIHRTESEIRIPGYLFQSRNEPPSRLNQTGELVQPIPSGHSLQLTLRIPPGGGWSLAGVESAGSGELDTELLTTAEGLRIELRNAGGNDVELSGVVLRRS